MGTKCSGCDAAIFDIMFMECSQEPCKKMYHLKCIAVTADKFASFTQDYKDNWVCPECTCAIPKRDNSNTPVRGSIILNKTFTPSSYVNTERGGRLNPNESVLDTESKILEELREFRLEMKARLDEQAREYTLLKNRFNKTETQLQELRKIMTVVQEKANKADILETKIIDLTKKNEQMEQMLSSKTKIPEIIEPIQHKVHQPIVSFAQVVSQNQAKSVATKRTNLLANEEKVPNINNNKKSNSEYTAENNKNTEGGDWTVINRKKSRYSKSEVKKGGRTNLVEIQGTERKKYLHVWRLQRETSSEKLENYVQNICGEDVPIKVDKIKHKTERDYASFIIGVPESKYNELCKPENWPVNMEFCEWVWFRKTAGKTKSPD